MHKKKYPEIKIGQQFGKLTVVKYDSKHADGRHYWYCSCSCNGNIKSYKKENLNNGNSTSCGCGRTDHTITNNKDYTGMTNSHGTKLIKFYSKTEDKRNIWECECGYCGSHFFAIPADVLSNHTKSCGCLKKNNYYNQTRKVKYSFEQWCLDNNHSDYLELWDYEKNKLKPSEVGYASTNPVYFKCHNNPSHLSYKGNLSHATTRGDKISCPTCNSFGYWVDQTFGKGYLDEIWGDKNTGINPYVISKASGTKIHLKCTETDYHGTYLITAAHYYNGGRCPYCDRHSGKIHPKDSLGNKYPDLKNRWSIKNTKSPYEFAIATDKKIWLTCPCGKHEDYLQAICNAVRCEFRCVKCTEESLVSNYQNKVASYIKNTYKYTLLHEQDCSLKPINPRTNMPMRYDNEIQEIKLIIEVNGESHYEVDGFNKLQARHKNISADEVLENNQFKDKFKKDFALDNGFHYLALPYWDIDNDNYKTIIDEKIKELTNS